MVEAYEEDETDKAIEIEDEEEVKFVKPDELLLRIASV